MSLARNSLFLLVGLLGLSPLSAQDKEGPDLAKLEKQRCPKPAEFVSVFSFGYVNDLMPQEDARFAELLSKIKEAGFNTIHCAHTDKRLELCKKHGVKMMVDLLVEQHHVYKNTEKAKALCEKLRDHPDVWGYNVWNDQFAKTTPGRKRDINNVRQWDPTHPAFSGTYRTSGMSRLDNPDIFGYYDFHWSRGIGQHFPHLLAYSNWAKERDAWFYTWLATTSGIAGKGNFNRSLYSANTGIACGLKGAMWFLGTTLMDPKTLTWTTAGQDIVKVNKEIMPLRHELGKLGNPTAIYSTSISKTENNKDLDKKDSMPPGLASHAFPKEFWLQPASGEFVLGVFKDGQKRDLAFLANHNAYAKQAVTLKLSRAMPAQMFNRRAGRWQPLEVRDGGLRFQVGQGGGELLRFGD